MEESLEKRQEEGQPGPEIKGPLKGIRVLDLGHAGAGPVGPTLLAEWGAEVIKVEIPEGGNVMRKIPPLHQGQSFMHLIQGRNKRSVTVDIHTEMGQEAIRRLVQESDVVLENYRPGTLERWNLGYEELKKVKEDVILVRVSGFGQEGPYRRRTSYDTVGAAMGGVHHLTGYPEDPPALLGYGMCDWLTAAFNALASLIALRYRKKTSQGQWADIPQYEAIFRLSEWNVAAYDKLGLARERTGNRHPSYAPSDLYLTKDGQRVVIEAVNDKIFRRLAHAMGQEELAEDPRFQTIARRVEHVEAINQIVAAWVQGKGLKEVVDTLVEAQVPVSPVYSSREICQDPHYRARGSLIELEDPAMGKVTVPNLAGRFSRTPAEIRDTGEPLGGSNQEILRQWLQFTEEEVAALKGEKGAVKAAAPEAQPAKGEEKAAAAPTQGAPEMALQGLRVLDLGTGLAGSFAGTLLADFGAEVLKVEEPGVGDTLRQMPPFYQEASLWWAVEGRNKKSITLDLRKERGKEAFKGLVARSDVMIESFRPGTLERWQLSYEELKKLNPGLILLRASGFGQDGPYRDRPSGEAVTSALAGFTYLNGFPDRPPVRPGYSLSSYTAGIFGAMSVLAALQERDQSGEGQSIDLALYEPLCRLSDDKIPLYDKLGILRERIGNRVDYLAPVGLYETRDGRWIAILGAPDEKDFGRMIRAMGREELAQDPRFNSIAQRAENHHALNELVADWVRGYDLKEATEILARHEVPMSPVFSIQDFFEDPHYQARGNILEVADPAMGSVKMQDVVPKLSLTPGKVMSAGPLLGQHNAEVYENLLGLSEAELDRLREEGVI